MTGPKGDYQKSWFTWSFGESININNIETFLVSSQWNMFTIARPIFCSTNQNKVIFADKWCCTIKLKVEFLGYKINFESSRNLALFYTFKIKNWRSCRVKLQLTIPRKVIEPWKDLAHFSLPATVQESSPCWSVQRLSISTNWSSTSLWM